MDRTKRKPNLVGLIVIGCGLIAVGISTDNGGILAGGIAFVVIGAASVVKDRRERKGNSSDDQQQQD
jgi:membrane-bound ClpP family serine protease